ncbi:MAG: DUF3299 domain-containing protein [Sulfurimonas sp.]|jgi:hypothetical protein|nr:DUF3299 domain-containing protein [Sulfurimonas sp.]
MKNFFIYILILPLFVACSNLPDYEVSDWNLLIDSNFNQKEIVDFYTKKVSKVPEASKEEIALYAQMQKALKQAGNNKLMDEKSIMLEGYLVPVDTDGERIIMFLFFPSQAACLHVPASPANQTIFVQTKKDEGVLLEDAYEQIRVYGVLKLKEKKVATGTASYIVNDAITRVVPLLN